MAGKAGMAGMAGRGRVRIDMVWRHMAGAAPSGEARPGPAVRGTARQVRQRKA